MEAPKEIAWTVLGFRVTLRNIALCCLTCQTTSAVIMTRYAKLAADPNDPPYFTSTLVLLTEVFKLIFSLLAVYVFDTTLTTSAPECLNLPDDATKSQVCLALIKKENFSNIFETMKLSVPALLYTLQNNLIYIALANLEATTFQVAYQSKVITTAILSVILLSRHLSFQKWISLFGLTVGIICTQLQQGAEKSRSNSSDNFLVGLIAVLGAAFCSAFAGVYFEKILKGTAPSVWMRNAQLAFFSIFAAIFGVFYVEKVPLNSFFQGYTTVVAILVLIQCAGGLIVAVVVKYADNILKGFATSLSIVISGLLSAILFEFLPTTLFLIGSVIVIVATFGYSLPDQKVVAQTTPLKEAP